MDTGRSSTRNAAAAVAAYGGAMRGSHQLGHRAHRAVQGGLVDCPGTGITDVATGVYRLPWEDELVMEGRTVGIEPAER
jgi:hypothetical protein